MPNPDPCNALGQAFFLRGTAACSPGFGRIVRQLRQANFWAEDLRSVGDFWIRRHLTAAHAAGCLRGPTMLVGYSRGGRHGPPRGSAFGGSGHPRRLAHLPGRGLPLAVAPNVVRAVHLYFGRKRIYPARPLEAAPGSPVAIENIDLDNPIRPGEGNG